MTSEASGNNKTASKTRVTLFNDFEEVVLPEFPEIRKTKEFLLKNGACGAVMSGSGASVISFFKNEEDAIKAADELKSANTASVLHTFS